MAELLVELRQRSEEKRRSGTYGASLPDRSVEDRRTPAFTVGPHLSRVAATADIKPYGPLQSRVPLLAPVVVALRRAVRRGLRWYLWPVTDRFSRHNNSVGEVVAAQARELARLGLETERLAREVELAQRQRGSLR